MEGKSRLEENRALAVILGHGQEGGRLWRTPTPSRPSWPWRGGAGSRRADCSGSSTRTWPRRRQALEDGYAELVKLAMESRSRLEESRLLWQFYWDMAEE